jgi:hypothetical protein
MAAKVFISYRRDHSAGQAAFKIGWSASLGAIPVHGRHAIPLGMNFVKVLHEEVAKCGVLLAVIGPNWLDLRDEAGNRRLDNPKDFVRIEIAAALQRDIPVIPILLDGAGVPKAAQLPKDLEELALRNGLDVRHASFHSDMDKLIRELKGQSGQAPAPPASRSPPEDHRKIEEAEARLLQAEEERRRGQEESPSKRDEVPPWTPEAEKEEWSRPRDPVLRRPAVAAVVIVAAVLVLALALTLGGVFRTPPVVEPPLSGVSKNELGPTASGGEFACSLEHSLKSLTGDDSVTVTFQNLSNEAISIYWLDYTGNRVFYRRINGGGSYTQQTYISHPWMLVDANGQCRKIILPGTSQTVITIR